MGTGRTTAAAQALRSLDGVHRVTDSGGTELILTVTDGAALLAGIVTTAARSGMTLASVSVTRPDLESVFLHLTGKALRD